MKTKKIYLIAAIIFVAIAALVYLGVKSTPKIEAPIAEKTNGNEQFEIIYYFGNESTHSQNVQKFLDENKIEEKVLFSKKEVWHNVENQKELDEKIMECGLDTNKDKNKIGVPFLYAKGKCFIGKEEVEKFFSKEVGISQ